ncbi:TraB/GumN family protein [Rheinheimera baltica]|uniref:TraB/GumN family protein n=1 Tax=Rheinheimera baltica TaxID=67576 RepID=A0ABT9HYC9_9GAMM|nr:TraB/GumN family protein [Rheinheimera baltica]MDP5136116.1 TraB/GumN family protein [Rheinheimera baltica]MDP5142924.1 TraB/GumN family protein [Rheinheimera baltica]MDP5149405.1 TraB/GumN family protein [Rheinheimera baltica]
MVKLTTKVIGLCAIATLFCSAALQADTSVWRVSKGAQQLYIGGTVHLLPPEQFPLPPAFNQAYDQADVLVFETDVRELETAQGMQLLMQQAMYSDGRNLMQVLSATTYKQLQQYAKVQGVDLAALNGFKPDFVLLTLMQVALQKAGMAGEGVDMHFLKQAVADNKPLLFLETVEQQLNMLLNVSANNEDAFVQQNLQQLSALETELANIIAAWRSGDRSAMAKLAMAYTDTPEGKQFYDVLLVQRNKNWLPQLEKMFATPEVELVLVGALHLAGEQNVLQLLQQQGYNITQL